MLPPTIVRIVKLEGEAKAFVIDAAEYREFFLESGLDVAVDEADYLAQNTDVANAITAGALPSGSYHYKFYGYFEGRPAKLLIEKSDEHD